MTMKEAIDRFVHDGDSIIIEGFTHLICFAAGHEVIRQRRRELTVCRLTPDLIYDQLIGAGCVKRLVFSWAGNPGAGPLHALRRAVEHDIPNPIELEEYSHFGMVARLAAGAADGHAGRPHQGARSGNRARCRRAGARQTILTEPCRAEGAIVRATAGSDRRALRNPAASGWRRRRR